MFEKDSETGRRLVFDEGTVERRALDLMHQCCAEPVCPVCVLAWLARAAGAPEATVDSVLDEMSAAVYREHGVEVSAAFDALAYRGHDGVRRRFEQIEALAQRVALEDFDGPPDAPVH